MTIAPNSRVAATTSRTSAAETRTVVAVILLVDVAVDRRARMAAGTRTRARLQEAAVVTATRIATRISRAASSSGLTPRRSGAVVTRTSDAKKVPAEGQLVEGTLLITVAVAAVLPVRSSGAVRVP
jgi:hypothetical protein